MLQSRHGISHSSIYGNSWHVSQIYMIRQCWPSVTLFNNKTNNIWNILCRVCCIYTCLSGLSTPNRPTGETGVMRQIWLGSSRLTCRVKSSEPWWIDWALACIIYKIVSTHKMSCYPYFGSYNVSAWCVDCNWINTLLCISLSTQMPLKSIKCPLCPLWFSGLEALLLTLGWVPKDRAILWAESDSWPVRSSEPCRCTRQARTTDSIIMNGQSGWEAATLFHTWQYSFRYTQDAEVYTLTILKAWTHHTHTHHTVLAEQA